jgi:hypothetical protein
VCVANAKDFAYRQPRSVFRHSLDSSEKAVYPFTRLPVQSFIGWSAPDTSLLVDAKIAVRVRKKRLKDCVNRPRNRKYSKSLGSHWFPGRQAMQDPPLVCIRRGTSFGGRTGAGRSIQPRTVQNILDSTASIKIFWIRQSQMQNILHCTSGDAKCLGSGTSQCKGQIRDSCSGFVYS